MSRVPLLRVEAVTNVEHLPIVSPPGPMSSSMTSMSMKPAVSSSDSVQLANFPPLELPQKGLVALSIKRSALTAAHLCDAVLPVCPYRQWTLSLPFDLRFRLIRDSRLFSAMIRAFVRTLFAWQRRQAKALGYAKVHTGSVTFAQRFGSLLQLNPHPHTWVPDGVFVDTDDGGLRTALF